MTDATLTPSVTYTPICICGYAVTMRHCAEGARLRRAWDNAARVLMAGVLRGYVGAELIIACRDAGEAYWHHRAYGDNRKPCVVCGRVYEV